MEKKNTTLPVVLGATGTSTDSPLDDGREFTLADLVSEPLNNTDSSIDEVSLERPPNISCPLSENEKRSRSPSASRSKLAFEIELEEKSLQDIRAEFGQQRPSLHPRKQSSLAFTTGGPPCASGSLVDVDQSDTGASRTKLQRLNKPRPQMSRQSTASSTVVDTRYVNMLLAMDHISATYDVLAFISTWLLLAGFIVLPGTLRNLGLIIDAKVGDEVLQKALNIVLDRVPLSAIATGSSGLGLIGMLCLWFRWRANYIWIVRKIFLPGCFNGLAGLLGALINIYTINRGHKPKFALIVLIVVSSVTGVCLFLALFYEFVLLERVKREHVRQVGKHGAGKRGEGVLKTVPVEYVNA